MADAIGIAAGIIELIKIGKKVVDLCREIKHAPQKIIERQQQLDNNLRLFRTHADRSILLSDQEFATRIIKQCINRLQEIERLLNDLASQLKGGPTRRALASVSTVRKDSELQSSFDDLQRDMEILTSIFTGQTLAMLSSIEAGQVELRKELALQGFGQSEFRKEVISMIARLAPLQVPTMTIGNTIEPNTGNLDRKDVCDVRAQNAVFAYAKSVNSADELSGIPAPYFQGYHPTSNIECDCKSRPKLFLWSIGALSFRDKRGHNSDCPLFGGNDREVSVALRLAVPFASGKYFQLDCSTSWGTFGVSLSPGIKLRALVVDRNQSPAFACIRRLGWQLKDSGFFRSAISESAALAIFQSVIFELRTLLQRKPYLVHEQDTDGKTVLWDFIEVILDIYEENGHWHPDLSPAIKECVTQAIKMMVLDHGADPNTVIHFSSKNQRIICYDGQTIMDTVLTRNRMYQPLEKSVGVDVIEDVSVDQILNDCGFLPLKVSLSVDKDAVSKSPGRLSYKFVTRLSNCPDVAEEMGCPDHYLAIFRKSLDRLHTCTQKGVDWTRRHEGLPEPIACALGWPEGLSFLLNLDLDAKSAVATARIQGITEAIRILISHQVPPFYQSTPGFPGVSILAPYEDEETRNLVFQYVADARKELAQLGLQNLERGTPEWEHLQHLSRTGTLVDERALEIWKALEASQKVPAPKLRHLWPGESKSVYFDSCIIPHEFYSADSGEHDFYFEKNQNIVQSLLSLGFHNIDVAEEDGTTLFLKACSQSQIDWASYFLSNGAQPDPKGLWLAVRAFWGWNHRLPHPNWLMRLASKASCDSCRCHCSTSGCTPAAVLARRCLLGRSQRRHELISFTERMSLRSRRVAMRELCRLEVFEKLGMTHTCCSRATGWAPLKDDDAAAIHDEEENLKDTLEVFMSLFDHLFSQFDGRFNVFLRAWWAALELYLPEEDLDTSTVGYRGNKSHWLKLFADLHVEGPEQSKIIDDSGIFNVVCHFHVVVDPLARRFDAEDSNFFVADERLCRYLETLGVPDYTFQWMKMARDRTGWPDQEVHRPVKWRYTEQDDIKDGFPFTRDYIVPLIAAGIIRDIERDAWFPEELRELLENEGVIVSGKLRPAHWKEDAEDVFERHRDMFEEQGSSSSI